MPISSDAVFLYLVKGFLLNFAAFTIAENRACILAGNDARCVIEISGGREKIAWIRLGSD